MKKRRDCHCSLYWSFYCNLLPLSFLQLLLHQVGWIGHILPILSNLSEIFIELCNIYIGGIFWSKLSLFFSVSHVFVCIHTVKYCGLKLKISLRFCVLNSIKFASPASSKILYLVFHDVCLSFCRLSPACCWLWSSALIIARAGIQ